MKKLEFVRYDPELNDEEVTALYTFLEDEGDLPDEDPYVVEKKELLEHDWLNEEKHGYDMEDGDDIEKISHYASILQKIESLKDDDVLQIDLGV